jgi:hypothetical protein
MVKGTIKHGGPRGKKKRGAPSDTSMQSFGFKDISEVILCGSLFIRVDKLEEGLTY